MIVLVTGAGGQLGKSLLEESAKRPEFSFLFKNSIELDITKQESIENVFNENNIKYCINCAAYTAVDKAENEPEKAFAVNAQGVKNLAEQCKKSNTTLIHISTDFVFDGKNQTPYTELDAPNPLSVYGISKLKGEKHITSILNNYFIIRTSWLYSEYGNNFMKTMIRLAKENDELNIVSDQIGTPTYARDLASAILHIISSKKQDYGLYHYSNEGETTWYNFAKVIFKLSNSSIKVNPIYTVQYPTSAKRPLFNVLDKAKIKNTFNIEIPDWRASLKTAILKLND